MNSFLKTRLLILGTATAISLFGCNSGSSTQTASGNNFGSANYSKHSSTSNVIEYAYITNKDDNTLSVYAILDGEFVFDETVATGNSPSGVAVNSAESSVYVANASDNTITTYSISGEEANLTLKNTISNSLGSNPSCLVVSPDKKYLYVCNSGSIGKYTLNQDGSINSSGSIAVSGVTPNSIAFTYDGNYAYVSSLTSTVITAYGYSPTDGSLLVNAPNDLAYNEDVTGIVFDKTGNFLYYTQGLGANSKLYSYLTPSSGAPIFKDSLSLSNTSSGIALDNSGNYAYITDPIDNKVSSFDTTGNTFSPVSNATTGKNPSAIATGTYAPPLPPIVPTRFVYVTDYTHNVIKVYQVNSLESLVLVESIVTHAGPTAIAIDANDDFAYVTTASTNEIQVFKMESGLITDLIQTYQELNSKSDATSITLSKDGKYAYVTHSNCGEVFAYYVGYSAPGQLTYLNMFPTPSNSYPSGVVISNDGDYAYVTNNNLGNITVFKESNGVLSNSVTPSLSPTNILNKPTSISFDPSGRHAFITNAGSNRIAIMNYESSTQTFKYIGQMQTGNNPYGLSFEYTRGIMYVSSINDNTILTYTAKNGIYELTNTTNVGGSPRKITNAIYPPMPAPTIVPPTPPVQDSVEYVYATLPSGINLVRTFRAQNGVLTFDHDTNAGSSPWSIAVNSKGTHAYVTMYDGYYYNLWDYAELTDGYLTDDVYQSLQLPNNVGRTDDIVLSKTESVAYITNGTNYSLQVFDVNKDGYISTGGQQAVGVGAYPGGVAVIESYAYVTGPAYNIYYSYLLNSAGKIVTNKVNGAGLSNSSFPTSIHINPEGTYAYVTNNYNNGYGYSITIYKINGANLTYVSEVPAGSAPNGLTFDPNGRYIYVSNLDGTIWTYLIDGGIMEHIYTTSCPYVFSITSFVVPN